jgi:hypothetical protein
MSTDTPRLTIELVPRPLWGKSLATLYRKQWDVFRKECYAAAGHKCEICGGVGEGKRKLEAHEVWQYTITGNRGLQTLIRLIALCPTCHAGKHLGRTVSVMPEAERDKVVAHMARVNGWDNPDRVRTYYNETVTQWEKLNDLEWSQDISFLIAE